MVMMMTVSWNCNIYKHIIIIIIIIIIIVLTPHSKSWNYNFGDLIPPTYLVEKETFFAVIVIS